MPTNRLPATIPATAPIEVPRHLGGGRQPRAGCGATDADSQRLQESFRSDSCGSPKTGMARLAQCSTVSDAWGPNSDSFGAQGAWEDSEWNLRDGDD